MNAGKSQARGDLCTGRSRPGAGKTTIIKPADAGFYEINPGKTSLSMKGISAQCARDENLRHELGPWVLQGILPVLRTRVHGEYPLGRLGGNPTEEVIANKLPQMRKC